MPTSETRTQASITMPLSRMRSRTSMRLVPPGARSMGGMGVALPLSCSSWRWGWCDGRDGRAIQLPLQLQNAGFQTRDRVFGRWVCETSHQRPVVSPPVEPDLLGLVDRADEQADAYGEQLSIRQRNAMC